MDWRKHTGRLGNREVLCNKPRDTILPATGRIEITWHGSRETAFPGDYFIKPKVSSPLQIIEVMGKEYFEENYRIKQDNSMRNSENGQIRED